MPSALWGAEWRSPGRQIIVLHFMSCSWSLRANVGACRGSQNLGCWSLTPLKHTHTMSPHQIWLDCVKWYKRKYAHPPGKIDPLHPLFKVTRGHWNQHGSVSYLPLPNNNHRPISYHFQDKPRFQSKITKFCISSLLIASCGSSAWNFITELVLKTTRMSLYQDVEIV